MTAHSFSSLIQQFTRWAEAQPEILAAIVAGSLARDDGTADQWSDLDVFAFVTAPEKFTHDSEWLKQFGEIWAKALDQTPHGDPEWYVFYAGGQKADFLLMDVHTLPGDRLSDWVQHPRFGEVLPRGLRVLFDTTASQGKMPSMPVQRNTTPLTQENLDDLTNRFYLQVLKAGRLLHRSDTWRAQTAVDEELKSLLLTMIEWHAIADNGPDYDVWYDGRYITRWAAPAVLERLPQCFGGFDIDQLWQAFNHTMDLFDHLGQEVAIRKRLSYPLSVSKNIRNWLIKKPV